MCPMVRVSKGIEVYAPLPSTVMVEPSGLSRLGLRSTAFAQKATTTAFAGP